MTLKFDLHDIKSHEAHTERITMYKYMTTQVHIVAKRNNVHNSPHNFQPTYPLERIATTRTNASSLASLRGGDTSPSPHCLSQLHRECITHAPARTLWPSPSVTIVTIHHALHYGTLQMSWFLED